MTIDRLAWVDLETTGLDPERCQILEIAIVITDNQLREVAWFSKVLRPDVPANAFAQCDNAVLAMHTKNGLFLDMLKPEAASLAYVEIAATAFMRDMGAVESPMCGSTIGFDRAFLKKHSPTIHGLFHYRNIDVSTLKELAKRWLPDEEHPPKREAHRALDDIRESIEVCRFYRDRFAKGFAL